MSPLGNPQLMPPYLTSSVDGSTEKLRTNVRIRRVRFERCDLALRWRYSSFTECEFVACRFPGSFFQQVKFSSCTFRLCNFSHVTFERCKFISDCSFSNNSASVEELTIKATSLDASEFLGGLQTNVSFIPPTAETTSEYQRHRLVEDKLELAQVLYSSTHAESDVDRFFDAYKQLILSTLDWRIESHRFRPKLRGHAPVKRKRAVYWLKSFPKRAERWLVQLSGLLTDWGRSISRPMGFFFVVLLVFFYIYFQLSPGTSFKNPRTMCDPLLRAIDVTVVVGYTAHCDTENPALRWLTLFNMLLGLFWYSLIVPVLSRRLLR
jgi:hypothetical protein